MKAKEQIAGLHARCDALEGALLALARRTIGDNLAAGDGFTGELRARAGYVAGDGGLAVASELNRIAEAFADMGDPIAGG